MNTIICLSHFCEIHGPQVLLATRIAPLDLPFASETGTSCANCSYNVPQTTTTPVLRSQGKRHSIVTSRITSDPLLRDACVRALSVETLAKGQQSGSFTVGTSPATWGTSDPRTLNIVHVFRISDPRARGQRRAYAFIAVGDKALWRQQHRIQQVFESWARSISSLSERQLQILQHPTAAEDYAHPQHQSQQGMENGLSNSLLSISTSATPSPPLSLETSPHNGSGSPPRFPSPSVFFSTATASSSPRPGGAITINHHKSSQSTSLLEKASPALRSAGLTPVSSFLSAKTVDPDGYPRSSLGTAGLTGVLLANIPKTRSLAEIVGDEFFFLRLHGEVCGLLEKLIHEDVRGWGEGNENGDYDDVADDDDDDDSDDDVVVDDDDDDGGSEGTQSWVDGGERGEDGFGNDGRHETNEVVVGRSDGSKR